MPADEDDRSAEVFLELETVLREAGRADGSTSGVRTSGTVIAARRMPTSEVPEGHPRSLETPTALALDVRMGPGDETTVYVEWPETFIAETQLARVLSTVGIPPDSFVDLYGAEVPLAWIDGWYVIDLSPSRDLTDRSSRWVYAIVACLVTWGAILVTTPNPNGGLVLLVWPMLPLVTYFDLLYVREASDWEPGRFLWPLLAAVWIVNVPAGVLYLYKRVRALGPFWR